jgi:hypothetical protein
MKTISIRNRQMLSSTAEADAIPRTTLWERKKATAVKLHLPTPSPS